MTRRPRWFPEPSVMPLQLLCCAVAYVAGLIVGDGGIAVGLLMMLAATVVLVLILIDGHIDVDATRRFEDWEDAQELEQWKAAREAAKEAHHANP